MSNSTLHVSRSLGLAASIFVFVGYIVGASIFILPGSLGGITGPGLFVAYLLAGVPALVSCAVAAVVGCAFPVPAAGLALSRRILPPVFVAQGMWLVVLTVAIGTPLVALGFADYVIYFLPQLSREMTAIAAVVFFMFVNSRGVNIAATVQGLLVVIFCAALLLFSFGGIAHGSWGRMTPLFPNGLAPVFSVAMTVYFSYLGTLVVMEMAGEIKRPSRNIPLTLVIGFGLILFIYMLVPIALMMNAPWNDLGGSAAIVRAAESFLPPGLVTFVAAGALLAAATSINGSLMAQSRDILFGARAGLLPHYFATVSPESHVPVRAVFFLGALIIISILAGAEIKDYADIVVMAVMYLYAGLGYVVLRFPRVLPDVYQSSSLKYPLWLHDSLAWILMLSSLAILILQAWQSWRMFTGLSVFLVLVSVMFLFRRRCAEDAGACTNRT